MAVWLFVAFIVVPVAELWLISQVADLISWPLTLALLIGEAVLGAWLVKREGRSAWKRFRDTLGSRAKVPAVEVVDGALVLIGGTLLLTPGFLSDIAGFVLVIPPTRAVVNRMVRSRIRGRFGLGGVAGRGAAGPSATRAGRPVRPDTAPLDVEVVEVKRNPPPGTP